MSLQGGRFITTKVTMTGYLVILGYIILSVVVLGLLVATVGDKKATEQFAYLLAILPIGGFLALSLLLQTRMEYRLSQSGIELERMPATRISLIRGSTTHWKWADVSDYLTDEDRVLGRFGLLEIGLRVSPGSLRISPHRRKETKSFNRFVKAFHGYVEVLNADRTSFAVSVATIKPRITFYQTTAAKPLALGLLAISLGSLLAVASIGMEADTRWRLLYLCFMLCLVAAYVVSRVFYSKRPG